MNSITLTIEPYLQDPERIHWSVTLDGEAVASGTAERRPDASVVGKMATAVKRAFYRTLPKPETRPAAKRPR